MLCTTETEGALDLACAGWGKLVIWLAASGLVAVLRGGQDADGKTCGIVRTFVAFDWGVDAEPASDMVVSNLIWAGGD